MVHTWLSLVVNVAIGWDFLALGQYGTDCDYLGIRYANKQLLRSSGKTRVTSSGPEGQVKRRRYG